MASVRFARQALGRRTFTTTCCTCQSTPTPTYTAPIKAGVLPVYDEAIALLSLDREDKLKQLKALSESSDASPERLERLEIEAWINDPEVRWKAANGQGDLSKPVFRHLAELKWRRQGAFAILMQRITQMSLIPDIVPTFEPTLDLQLHHRGEVLEPGKFTLPVETRDEVKITAQVFHPEERLYTLLMIDPDVPDEANRTFTSFAHWLIPNIPLSSTQTTISTSSPTLPYIPPHPQQGTPYHRYTFLLFEQRDNVPLELVSEAIERQHFSVRAFVEEWGLQVKGISFFRQVWDAEVDRIYEEVLGTKPPRFTRPKKVNTYENKPNKYDIM